MQQQSHTHTTHNVYLPLTVTPTIRAFTNCLVLHSVFSALTLLVGRQVGHPVCKNWVVWCWHGYLSGARCRVANSPADATATHRLFPSVKSRLVLPLWYRLTRVVPDKGLLNGCVCVCWFYRLRKNHGLLWTGTSLVIFRLRRKLR